MRLWFHETTVILVFGFVSAQTQGWQPCVFAKASPKTHSASLHHFAPMRERICPDFAEGKINDFACPGSCLDYETDFAPEPMEPQFAAHYKLARPAQSYAVNYRPAWKAVARASAAPR